MASDKILGIEVTDALLISALGGKWQLLKAKYAGKDSAKPLILGLAIEVLLEESLGIDGDTVVDRVKALKTRIAELTATPEPSHVLVDEKENK